MRKRRLLILAGLVVYSLIVIGCIWIVLYFLINAVPNVKSPEEVVNLTPTPGNLTGSGIPDENINEEPASCHPNCSMSEINKAVETTRKIDKYSVNIILGFDCLSEYQRDYYGDNYEEVLLSSGCNSDQVGKKVRVVDKVRYVETVSGKWEQKNTSEADYFTLKQILPQSSLSDEGATYTDEKSKKVNYQDFLNNGIDIISFGYGQPDYEYYIYRKEGVDERCVSGDYDLFLQGSPEKEGDLDPSSCSNYIWFFSKGLRFMEYRTVGFEFKAVFRFYNFNNTEPIVKPI